MASSRPWLVLGGYAAAASALAAGVAYVMGPSIFPQSEWDGEADVDAYADTGDGNLKLLRPVGLSNPTNDCFINSVLQALAVLPHLRLFLLESIARESLHSSGNANGPRYGPTGPSDVDTRDGNDWHMGQGRGSTSDMFLTTALLDMLTLLINGRRKPDGSLTRVVSAQPFVRILELTYKSRINRRQQDAQELLQLVLQRLLDEHHFGIPSPSRRIDDDQTITTGPARNFHSHSPSRSRPLLAAFLDGDQLDSDSVSHPMQEKPSESPSWSAAEATTTAVATMAAAAATTAPPAQSPLTSASGPSSLHPKGSAPKHVPSPRGVRGLAAPSSESGSTGDNPQSGIMPSRNDPTVPPFSGEMRSQVQCLRCGFNSRPSASKFVSLTLIVPQKSACSLDECFDGLLKMEEVDEYKCTKCCLQQTQDVRRKERERAGKAMAGVEDQLSLITSALESDVDEVPPAIELLPPEKLHLSKIRKYVQISDYPRILVIHLSRSIFDASMSSRKNDCKVDFPERLKLGGFEKRRYKLMSLITHQGQQASGHYQTFRKQAEQQATAFPPASNVEPRHTKSNGFSAKWWRISDDHIRQCSISDVLGMRKEAYLLFYELIGSS